MARDTVRRTEREEVSLADPRPVQVQTSRRFFTANGNDRATREARALANAFGAGAELFGNEVVRRDQEGARQATAAAASGELRDIEESNKGYNRAWDMLDAENDLNEVKDELPEILRGADWENRSVEEVQGLIDSYMQENFAGLDGESAYAEVLAPGLLALEQELMETRRNIEVQRIRQDQRVKIYENLLDRFEESGQFDYQYLADQTNIFFDGQEKRVAYWESMISIAVENGLPEILENAPERFGADGKGDPTGATDPVFRNSELMPAIKEAYARKAALAKQKQDKEDAYNESRIFDLQLAVVDDVLSGGTGTNQLRAMAGVPGVTIGDMSAARNFAATYRDDVNEVAADLSFVAPLWTQIYDGTAGREAIWAAYARGDLGRGPHAIDEMKSMFNKVREVQSSTTATDPNVTVYRTQIGKVYNAQLGGPFAAVNPVMHRINLDANDFYTAQVSQGKSANDAYLATRERFDPLVEKLPDVDNAELVGRRSQSAFTAEQLVTADYVKAVAQGRVSFEDQFSGVNPKLLRARLFQLSQTGAISEDEMVEVLLNID